jgi:hypothetical protein
MSDASTARGGKPTEPITPEPFFPSEGDFNTVVPLSQVAHAPYTAGRSAADGRPAEAAWARADRRGNGVARRGAAAGEEEETLVPGRSGRRRGARVGPRPGAVRRPWAGAAAAVLLSVLAGVAAGSYLVWSKRPAVSNAPPAAETASQEVAADVPPPAPEAPPVVEAEPVAPEAPAPAKAAAATEAKPERSAETPARAEKGTPPPAEPTTRAAVEPATRAATQPRARAERAAPDTTPAATAARPARNETPTRNEAPTRRAATNAARRPTRPATSARQLPVSAPPPSSKSKTVIQWP